MAITAGEQQSGGEVRDSDGRLIVVGPGGVAIGGGGGGSDPLSDGTPGGGLPTKTLWVAGADGSVLRGITVNSSGHVLTAVQNFPAVQPVNDNGGSLTVDGTVGVSNFPATQPVSGTVTANQGTANTAANGWPAKVTDGTNTASVLNAAPGSDTGQSALAVRVVSQLGAGSGGSGGTQFAEDAALGATPTGTLAMARRTDTLGTLTPVVDDAVSQRTNSRGALWVVHDGNISIGNFPATQAVSGTVTANAGTGPWPVTDNSGSLTVDAPVGTPVFVRLSDGTSAIATLPVSLASLPALAAGSNTIGKVDQGVGGASAWKVDGSAVTQPVSLAAVPTVTEKQDQPASTNATWTSATGANTAVTVNTTGYGTANVSVQVPSTVTAGIITIEVSDDAGTTYYPAGAVRVDNGLQENVVALAQTPGLALNRMYAVSVDAMTQVRARLSTVITGSGNVLVRVGTVAGGIEPFVAQRSRKVTTYSAVYRAAARPYLLSKTFTANTRTQFATIHHAAAATKTVRIRLVQVNIIDNSVAVNGSIDLVRITTAPATGNPAVTASASDSSSAAAEATMLALPTTAATEAAAVHATCQFDLGATGATLPVSRPVAATVNNWIDVFRAAPGDDEAQLPTIRAGVLEGWSVTGDMDSATVFRFQVYVQFTEEAP